jgi:hypothetical protein
MKVKDAMHKGVDWVMLGCPPNRVNSMEVAQIGFVLPKLDFGC